MAVVAIGQLSLLKWLWPIGVQAMLANPPLNIQPKLFSGNDLIIRQPAEATSVYLLCDSHVDGQGIRNGDIKCDHANIVTYKIGVIWASLTSIELKTVFLPFHGRVGHAQMTDLASTAASGQLEVTTASGTFSHDMVGSFLKITAGTTWRVGYYQITEFNSPQSITVGKAVGTALTDLTSGTGTIVAEAQECDVETLAGVSSITPHEIQLSDTGTDEIYVASFPLPAAPFMRVYVKGTGTVDDSSITIGVQFAAPGGV